MAQAVKRLGTRIVTIGKKTPEYFHRLQKWIEPREVAIMRHAKGELAPPRLSEFKEIGQGISNITKRVSDGTWRNLSTKEALLNSMICAEIFFWFCIGECIGKRSLIGYGQVHKKFPVELKFV